MTSYLTCTVGLNKPVTTCVDDCPRSCLYQMGFTQVNSVTASFKPLYSTYETVTQTCDCTVYNVIAASITGNVATGPASGGGTGELAGHSTTSLLLTYSNSTGSTFCQLLMSVDTGSTVLGAQPQINPGNIFATFWWAWTVGIIVLISVSVGVACFMGLFARCCMRERTSKGQVLASNTGVIGPFVPIAGSAAPPMAYVVAPMAGSAAPPMAYVVEARVDV